MEGAEEIIGTQWVEVDRNEKIRVESEQAGEAKHVPMNLKSRLVALGNQEKREMRSDSPTADAEGTHLVFSFCEFQESESMVRRFGECLLYWRTHDTRLVAGAATIWATRS